MGIFSEELKILDCNTVQLCSMHIKLPCLVTMKISKLGLNSWAYLFADGQGAADHAFCAAHLPG